MVLRSTPISAIRLGSTAPSSDSLKVMEDTGKSSGWYTSVVQDLELKSHNSDREARVR